MFVRQESTTTYNIIYIQDKICKNKMKGYGVNVHETKSQTIQG